MPLQVLKRKIGDAEITQIVEIEIGPLLAGLIAPATPEEIKKIEWLKQPFANEDGSMNGISQTFIVQINDRILMVDTCIGNDKSIEAIAEWNHMQTDFIQTLEDAGFDRNKVTDVLCTHLHVDHVGWNTYKKDGKWLPTFPNAKYHFAKSEFDYWFKDSAKDPMAPVQDISFQESVKPVFDAGLVNFIDTNADLGDGISVISTPGHTISHVSVLIKSGGEKFMIGGDVMHHPCQIAKPDWATVADYDGKQSSETRKKLFSELAGSDTLFTASHFSLPSFGHISKDENGNFEFTLTEE